DRQVVPAKTAKGRILFQQGLELGDGTSVLEVARGARPGVVDLVSLQVVQKEVGGGPGGFAHVGYHCRIDPFVGRRWGPRLVVVGDGTQGTAGGAEVIDHDRDADGQRHEHAHDGDNKFQALVGELARRAAIVANGAHGSIPWRRRRVVPGWGK